MGGQELGNFFDLAKKGDGAKAGVDLSIFAQGLQETEFKSRAAARQPDGRDGQGDRLMGGQRPESDRISGTLNAMDIDGSHKQMVVVHSNSWGSANGSLEPYERNPSGDGWHSTGQHWDVSLGMTGMGWGRGVLSGDVDPGPGKMEGDKRSPAGVFNLGSAFGYDATAPAGSKMPYRQATNNDYFVDDPTSRDYNKWVRLSPQDDPNSHWRSFERMKLRGDQYKLGLVVNHNMEPTVPSRGSAIFMHIWSRPGGGTVGCTAMSEGNMRRLLNWLDPNQKPLLMQVPDQVMPSLRGARVK